MTHEQLSQTWAARVGSRVVVRHRLPEGGATDTVGRLEALEQPDDGASRLRVSTARGDVVVALDAVLLGKVVPPKAARRGPPHAALSIGDLQRVMDRHWVAERTEPLGQWLLRADGSDGHPGSGSRRVNSALAVGDPGLPLPAALEAVRGWYRVRGRRALVMVAGPQPQVRATLDELGWRLSGDSAYAMTASTAQAAALRRPISSLGSGLTLGLATEPDDGWLATSSHGEQTLPAPGLRLLRSADEQVFASVRDGERTVAVARGSLAQAWGGVTAVAVLPEHRRRGLARLLLGELASWARERGAASMFLQTTTLNAPAQALYSSSGFTIQHRYDYLTPADPPDPP